MGKKEWIYKTQLSFHVDTAEEAIKAWKEYPEGYILGVKYYPDGEESFSHFYEVGEIQFTGAEDVDYIFYTGVTSVTYLPGWWVIYRSYEIGLTLNESILSLHRMGGGPFPDVREYYMLTYGNKISKYSDEYYDFYEKLTQMIFG